MSRRFLLVATAATLAAAACGSTGDTTIGPQAVVTTIIDANAPAGTTKPIPDQSEEGPIPPVSPPRVVPSHHRTDGNRLIDGRGALPAAEPIDVAVGGVLQWVIGVPVGTSVIWLVAREDGSLLMVRAVDDGSWETVARRFDLAPGQPFAGIGLGDGVEILASGDGESRLTHPLLESSGAGASVLSDGSVRRWQGDDVVDLEVPALPDARILSDGEGRILYLGRPSRAYGHGVLGDAVEAEAVVLASGDGAVQVIVFPEGLVAEGLSPIWTDVDGDGTREILVTLSDDAGGARLALFAEDGTRLADSLPIGRGSRWRHQIAVGPAGPGYETEIVDVRTPHIGGIVEFLRWSNDRLDVVASVPGFTSHVIGSRNLDLALMADADGDGRLEVVLPTQDRTALGGIRRTTDGAEVAWSAAVGGRMTSNLGAAVLSDGTTWFAAGREDGMLRIWPG